MSTTKVYVGPGFTALLTLSFIILKLTHTITWSWWLVLLPIWLPWALLGTFMLMVFIAACTVELVHFFSE